MIDRDYPFGFRVVGGVHEQRSLVDADTAFVAHCSTDPRCDLTSECYLSAFQYGRDFRAHLDAQGSPKGFTGPTWSKWLWFDIDRADDIAAALSDARKLAGFALDRYQEFDDDDLLLFFSGSKGFHVGVPLTHRPGPSVAFHRVCRQLAEALATNAGVKIDAAIYDRVRLFRAPNSRHPKTGLHKRRLTLNELMRLTADRVRELAREPLAFDLPTVAAVPSCLVSDWQEAERRTDESKCPAAPSGRLNRDTLAFIQKGADDGERTNRLFQAAANLREFDAPAELVHALLTEPALDCELPPGEVRRVIECGIQHAERRRGGSS